MLWHISAVRRVEVPRFRVDVERHVLELGDSLPVMLGSGAIEDAGAQVGIVIPPDWGAAQHEVGNVALNI